MRFQHIFFILIISITFAGCSSCEEVPDNKNTESTPAINTATPTNSNQNVNVNTNSNIANNGDLTNLPPAVPKPKETVEAVTLKPLVKAYCDAMNNNDEEGLRKSYSQQGLQKLLAKMKDDGATSLLDYLSLEAPGNKCEVVNETISGNTAKAYVITEAYPDGTSFNFVKENNEWKMTGESDDINRVKEK